MTFWTNNLDPNIAALRSVSPQHKQMMQRTRDLAIAEAEDYRRRANIARAYNLPFGEKMTLNDVFAGKDRQRHKEGRV